MNEDQDAPASAESEQEPELAPYLIEAARSSRSKCRTCKRKIEKDTPRLGILLEGPYGTGYLWHHLKCAAKRKFEDVEAAYEQEAWTEKLELPSLDELRKLKETAEKKKADQKESPWTERAKSGRSKCKHCGELIEKDSFRVILDRTVEFFGQERRGPVNIHPGCVAAELQSPDCPTEVDDFAGALKRNSGDGIPAADMDALIAEIGDLD